MSLQRITMLEVYMTIPTARFYCILCPFDINSLPSREAVDKVHPSICFILPFVRTSNLDIDWISLNLYLYQF